MLSTNIIQDIQTLAHEFDYISTSAVAEAQVAIENGNKIRYKQAKRKWQRANQLMSLSIFEELPFFMPTEWKFPTWKDDTIPFTVEAEPNVVFSDGSYIDDTANVPF